MNDNRQMLRVFVRGAYDLQKLRIMLGNRIAINFRAKLGQAPGTKTEDMEEESKKVLDIVKASYKRLTDGIVAEDKLPQKRHFKGDEVISTYTELTLVSEWVSLEREESRHFRRLEGMLQEFPVYTTFLEGVRGCGPAMAGVILSEIDITKANYASSLWMLAGLDVAPDGRGRGRYKEHLVKRAYTTKDGQQAERDSITFNPWLKTKLVGVLGSSFVKCGGPYRVIYDGYKRRMENHNIYGAHRDAAPFVTEDGREIKTSKGRRHNMAVRYTVKQFLADLWKAWRTLEGLPTPNPYHEAKLGMPPHSRAA